MAKRMLIDATHAEETRVVVLDGNRLEDFDVETSTKKQLKGNIYLAKVVRVEPSLQAAFVEYGGNRHGFLAFGEIHPDYYQIPVADRQRLLEMQAEEARRRKRRRIAPPRQTAPRPRRAGAAERPTRAGRSEPAERADLGSREDRRAIARSGSDRGCSRPRRRRRRTRRGASPRASDVGATGLAIACETLRGSPGETAHSRTARSRDRRQPMPRRRMLGVARPPIRHSATEPAEPVGADRTRRQPMTTADTMPSRRADAAARDGRRRRRRRRRRAATGASRRASCATTRSRRSSAAGRSCWCRWSRRSAAPRARR